MLKRYLCISAYHDKETGEPVSTLAEVIEGISKKTGKQYQIAETQKTTKIPRFVPIGTIVTYEMAEVTITEYGEINPVSKPPENGGKK